jgi:hypothetical protein
MTTRLTFNPRLRIKVLFPRLVGFAEDAISGPGSVTLLSALISETGTVNTGEAAGTVVGDTEVPFVSVGRVAFAVGGAIVAISGEPDAALSIDGTLVTETGGEIPVDVEEPPAFSADAASRDVVAESVSADDGAAVDAVSTVVGLPAFVGVAEAAGGAPLDAVLDCCPAVPVTGGIRDCFAAGAAPVTIVVAGAVDDPVDGTSSVIAF